MTKHMLIMTKHMLISTFYARKRLSFKSYDDLGFLPRIDDSIYS